jgi:hypothetical protein
MHGLQFVESQHDSASIAGSQRLPESVVICGDFPGAVGSRLLMAVVLAVVVVMTAGCPSSAEKPGAEPRASQSKPPASDDSVAASKLPADEFQHPPVLPANEPPPRLTDETADEPGPVTAQVAPPYNGSAASKRTEPPPQLPKKTASKDRARPKTAKNSGVPFDPVKENGAIFAGWPKPQAAIVITGMEHGYVEPCGCAGLDRMLGGMSRRFSLIQDELRKKRGWPTIALDLGGLANGRNAEAEIKFRTLAESKVKMGYNAVGFGAEDLQLPPAELVLAASDVDGKPGPFISANVGLFGFNQHVTQTSRVIAAGGRKIGVTAVLGKQFQREVENALVDKSQVEMRDSEAALKEIVPELKRNADYLVLLANATQNEAVALAQKFPEFNAVVCAADSDLPSDRMETIKGTDTLLIAVGRKGAYSVVLGLYNDPKEPVRYQRVPLDSRFPPSPEMKRLMATFQEQLKVIGFRDLGFRPVAHPLAEQNGCFVGSKACESCHEKSYEIWKKSRHAKAYETLAKLDPPRNFDPECVSCHVVGWHAVKPFPYKTGFESVEKTPLLVNAGCEGCHGPGEKHCNAELGSDESLRKKYRQAVVVTKEQCKKEQCSTCHDVDNSPEFNFDLYWPLVEHYEKEKE